jgi:hypothetical protein
MRSSTTLAVAILILITGGCQERSPSPTAGKGDVRQFILAQSVALGGRPAHTNDLPPLTSEWTFQRDKLGMYISLPREEFSAVDIFLRHVFGPPSTEPRVLRDGNRAGSYLSNAVGCVIFYSTSATNCVISLLKPVITSRDIGHHTWTVRVGNGTYGIYGNSAGTGIVIVQGSIFVPMPFWGFVTLVGLSVLVIIGLLWFFIRRHANAA